MLNHSLGLLQAYVYENEDKRAARLLSLIATQNREPGILWESMHFRGIYKSFKFIDYFLKRGIYHIQLKMKILVPFHPK